MPSCLGRPRHSPRRPQVRTKASRLAPILVPPSQSKTALAARLTFTPERWGRRDLGTLDVTLTIDDPKAYTRPWTVDESPSRLILDQDLLEYVCTENNKDVEHLAGDGRK